MAAGKRDQELIKDGMKLVAATLAAPEGEFTYKLGNCTGFVNANSPRPMAICLGHLEDAMKKSSTIGFACGSVKMVAAAWTLNPKGSLIPIISIPGALIAPIIRMCRSDEVKCLPTAIPGFTDPKKLPEDKIDECARLVVDAELDRRITNFEGYVRTPEKVKQKRDQLKQTLDSHTAGARKFLTDYCAAMKISSLSGTAPTAFLNKMVYFSERQEGRDTKVDMTAVGNFYVDAENVNKQADDLVGV
jgi:hypothetical protein